jgi:hypothetical protein
VVKGLARFQRQLTGGFSALWISGTVVFCRWIGVFMAGGKMFIENDMQQYSYERTTK